MAAGLKNASRQVRSERADTRVGATSSLAHGPADSSLRAQIIALNSTAGNQAVRRLLPARDLPANVPPAVKEGLHSSHSRLDSSTRAEMEESFSYDLRSVRLHSGETASRSARLLNARAYTVGSDIVLGGGQPAPGSPSGKRLLAHELAHVIQQSRAASTYTVMPGAVNNGLEHQAAAASNRVASGQPAGALTGAPAMTVQRVPMAIAESSIASHAAARKPIEQAPEQPEADLGATAQQIAWMFINLMTLAVPGLRPGPWQKMLFAGVYGLIDESYQMLVVQGKGALFLERMQSISGSLSRMAKFAGGYWLGILEGLVSPITDIFGLMLFSEQLSNIARQSLLSAFKNRKAIAAEAQSLAESFKQFAKSGWEIFKQDPVGTLSGLMEAASKNSEQAAEKVGRIGAKALVSSLNSAWDKPGKSEAGKAPIKERGWWDSLSQPLGTIDAAFKSFKETLISSPWAKIGETMGKGIGTVLMGIALFAVSGGIGNLIQAFGRTLGALAPAMRLIGTLAGSVGKAIAALEKVIDAVFGIVMKPLEPLMMQLLPLFDDLMRFLKRFLGLSDEAAGATVSTATKAAGRKHKKDAKQLAGDTTPQIKPVTKPGDIVLDEFWQKIKNENQFLRSLIKHMDARPDLVSGETFAKILQHAAIDSKGEPEGFITKMNRMMAYANTLKSQGNDTSGVAQILNGLASDDPGMRKTAGILMERSQLVPSRKGLIDVNDTLQKLNMDEINTIFDLQPPPAANIDMDPDFILEYTDQDLIIALNKVVSRVDFTEPGDIRRLVEIAGANTLPGAPDPDLLRLENILEFMPPGKVSVSEVREAILQRNSLAQEIASLGDDYVEGVLKGVSFNGGKLQVRQTPQFLEENIVSGSRVTRHFRQQSITDGVVAAVTEGGQVSEARWKKIQKTIRKSDMETGAANNILGYYWEQIRVQVRKAAGEEVFPDKVFINVRGTDLTSRADIVSVQRVDKAANRIYISIEECKVGDAVMSDAQKKVKSIVDAAPNSVHPELEVILPPEVLNRLDRPDEVEVVIIRFKEERAPKMEKDE